MRTTLTLDADVAALLKRSMSRRKSSLKDEVNRALRLGLMAADKPTPVRRRTRSYDGGRCLLGDLTSVSEALAIAEVEAHAPGPRQVRARRRLDDRL